MGCINSHPVVILWELPAMRHFPAHAAPAPSGDAVPGTFHSCFMLAFFVKSTMLGTRTLVHKSAEERRHRYVYPHPQHQFISPL